MVNDAAALTPIATDKNNKAAQPLSPGLLHRMQRARAAAAAAKNGFMPQASSDLLVKQACQAQQEAEAEECSTAKGGPLHLNGARVALSAPAAAATAGSTAAEKRSSAISQWCVHVATQVLQLALIRCGILQQTALLFCRGFALCNIHVQTQFCSATRPGVAATPPSL